MERIYLIRNSQTISLINSTNLVIESQAAQGVIYYYLPGNMKNFTSWDKKVDIVSAKEFSVEEKGVAYEKEGRSFITYKGKILFKHKAYYRCSAFGVEYKSSNEYGPHTSFKTYDGRLLCENVYQIVICKEGIFYEKLTGWCLTLYTGEEVPLPQGASSGKYVAKGIFLCYFSNNGRTSFVLINKKGEELTERIPYAGELYHGKNKNNKHIFRTRVEDCAYIIKNGTVTKTPITSLVD